MKALSTFRHRSILNNILLFNPTLVRRVGHGAGTRPRLSLRAALLATLLLPATGQALDLNFGPFTLTGFAKAEVTRNNNDCSACQLFPDEDKQRVWADEIVPGRPYETTTNTVTLFQPYLGAQFDLGGGFKLYGLLSQRWRDGKVDVPDYLFEANIAIGHEDYGSVRLGSMTTRGWSIADFPYGSDIGLAFEWADSGAAYGLLKYAARYTTRPFDVAGGDLVLEATYSPGNTDFKIHKPQFWEIWAQYRNGPLGLDFIWQDTRNGRPVAFGQSPFSALSTDPDDDSKLGGSKQGIAMLMGRYDLGSGFEVTGGVRRNYWSGAYAVVVGPRAPGQQFDRWNAMFNVDWGGTRNGVPNPGYAATSVDYLAGLRYRFGEWIASTGFAYLGKANTDNPSERGQSNWATYNTAGLQYDFGNGLFVYGLAGLVHYGHLGLSPVSMPGNAAFTKVDSRVSRNGNWVGLGTVFVF